MHPADGCKLKSEIFTMKMCNTIDPLRFFNTFIFYFSHEVIEEFKHNEALFLALVLSEVEQNPSWEEEPAAEHDTSVNNFFLKLAEEKSFFTDTLSGGKKSYATQNSMKLSLNRLE